MDWVFDHLQFIIAAAGAVAWWLNQRRQAQADEDAPPREEASFDDPELAERTRRIREEIKRKIEERAGRYANEQPTLPRDQPPELPPVMREVIFRQPEPPPRVHAASHVEAQRQAEMLEQQAALAEQLRQAQEMKAAAQRRVAFEAANADKETAVLAQTRTTVLGDLRSPEALRRAFILREVLGPPVALR